MAYHVIIAACYIMSDSCPILDILLLFPFRYAISNTAGNTYFQINSTTGRITTKALLDYETMVSHLIVASATDQLTSIASQAFIVVNVTNANDGMLIITAPSSVSVSELSSKGSFVALIRATDSDSHSVVSYEISSGNTKGLFTIDPSTGIVQLNSSLNYDVDASHMITICAMEQTSGARSCHNMTVNVKNENNKQTTFGQTSYLSNTPLNSTVGTVVAQVTATDPDGLSKFNYTLDGAIANEYFTINSTTGEIKLKKSLSGASLPSPVVFVACATDNGNPTTTSCVPIIVNTG